MTASDFPALNHGLTNHDGRITLRPHRNDRDGRLDQLLNAVYVGLCLRWQLVKLAHILSGLHPAVHLNIFRLIAFQPAAYRPPNNGQTLQLFRWGDSPRQS